ncbi:MAG: hypothetical protein HQ594_06485 [Candidatus Omnitrophica bacterium]|nr:hypothetical protein [Candidatus Omnitrophota bacterium]
MRKFMLITILLTVIAIPRALAFDISRPSEGDKPTEVRMAVYLVDVDAIDTVNQSFEANVFYMCQWKDPRLAHDGKEEIGKSLNEVWNPRIQLLNQQRVWATFPEMVEISPDGTVTYRQRVWGHFSQPLNLRDFPFDEQTFNVNFIATGYSPDEVKLIQDPTFESGIAERFSVADWSVLNWKARPHVFQLPNLQEKRELFTILFEAKRQSGYFVVKVIVPLIFIVAMSWVVFWIDPKESGTQINVAITAMLTLIAYRFMVGMDLPKFSYLTRLDYFILFSTILVFASLLEVVITSALAKNNMLEQARAIDRWARWIFPGAFLLLSLEALVFNFLT